MLALRPQISSCHVQQFSDWCCANDVHLDKEAPLQEEYTSTSVTSHLRSLHDTHECGSLEFPLQLVPPYSPKAKCQHGHLFNSAEWLDNQERVIIHKVAVTKREQSIIIHFWGRVIVNKLMTAKTTYFLTLIIDTCSIMATCFSTCTSYWKVRIPSLLSLEHPVAPSLCRVTPSQSRLSCFVNLGMRLLDCFASILQRTFVLSVDQHQPPSSVMAP